MKTRSGNKPGPKLGSERIDDEFRLRLMARILANDSSKTVTSAAKEALGVEIQFFGEDEFHSFDSTSARLVVKYNKKSARLQELTEALGAQRLQGKTILDNPAIAARSEVELERLAALKEAFEVVDAFLVEPRSAMAKTFTLEQGIQINEYMIEALMGAARYLKEKGIKANT